MEEFKQGDIVRLKSGSPDMTVTEVEKSSDKTIVACLYFDKENRSFYPENIPAVALKKSNSKGTF